MIPELYQYFEQALEISATDLILKPDSPPVFKLNKQILVAEEEKIPPQHLSTLFLPVLDVKQQEKLRTDLSVSGIVSYRYNKCRIRYNIFKERRGLVGTFRFISPKVSSIEELRLPQALTEIALLPKGLFLVTGHACSGKTSTIAAMIDSINQFKSHHLIIIEKPIEKIFIPKQSIFTQIEVGDVATSYQEAISIALREDPNVIVIGELTSQELIEQTLKVSEAGHLVITSLPTMGAPQTIEHIVSAFPPERQDEIRSRLSFSLIGIFSQTLIPSINPISPPQIAYELMIVNSAMRNLIRDKKISHLSNAMAISRRDGNLLLKDSLEKLLKDDNLDHQFIRKMILESEE